MASGDDALREPSLTTDDARVKRFRPAMAALLEAPDPLPAWAYSPYEGGAVGNLLHDGGPVFPFPFEEVAPGRWIARVRGLGRVGGRPQPRASGGRRSIFSTRTPSSTEPTASPMIAKS